LHPGVQATLQLPGQHETFEAVLVSLSNSIAENSRTSLVELQADNPDGKLWPGAFAEVRFHLPADANTLSIPTTALIFGALGLQVAAVDGNNRIELKPVVLGRNLGNRVEVQSGLSAEDRLVDSPLESTQNGDTVRIAVADGSVKAELKTSAAAEQSKHSAL